MLYCKYSRGRESSEMSGEGSCFICNISCPACPACGLVSVCKDHVGIHRSDISVLLCYCAIVLRTTCTAAQEFLCSLLFVYINTDPRSGQRCNPFTIRYSPEVGHHMVATRDIKQMELILSEEPVVVGPHTKSETLHCVACLKKIGGEKLWK